MRVAALACVLAAAACDTAVHHIEIGPLDAAPACESAKDHSDLEWIQANIFDKSCSLSTACHKGTASEAVELSLDDGKSHTQLVGTDGLGADCMSEIAIPPAADHTWKRVVPGHPETSYLMVLIDPKVNPSNQGPTDPDGLDGPLDPKVGSMPVDNSLLCKEKRDAILRWIEQGASDTGTPDAALPDAGVDASVDAQ